MADALRLIGDYVRRHYHEVQLDSAIGYVTSAERMSGRDEEICTKLDCQLNEARTQWKALRAKRRKVC